MPPRKVRKSSKPASRNHLARHLPTVRRAAKVAVLVMAFRWTLAKLAHFTTEVMAEGVVVAVAWFYGGGE